jgi:hypothetical protein
MKTVSPVNPMMPTNPMMADPMCPKHMDESCSTSVPSTMHMSCLNMKNMKNMMDSKDFKNYYKILECP